MFRGEAGWRFVALAVCAHQHGVQCAHIGLVHLSLAFLLGLAFLASGCRSNARGTFRLKYWGKPVVFRCLALAPTSTSSMLVPCCKLTFSRLEWPKSEAPDLQRTFRPILLHVFFVALGIEGRGHSALSNRLPECTCRHTKAARTASVGCAWFPGSMVFLIQGPYMGLYVFVCVELLQKAEGGTSPNHTPEPYPESYPLKRMLQDAIFLRPFVLCFHNSHHQRSLLLILLLLPLLLLLLLPQLLLHSSF